MSERQMSESDGREETCGICGANVVYNDDLQLIECKSNSSHVASYWDNEWVDFSAKKQRIIKK